ncbi:uncharacterized protein E5676_scaffold98G001180 [Cucumis melo var. makuwa]|uniref:Ulp1-like peptidase n=1 Tax=Cucumis melo var. makuwa TaxID=1194695 RepID=A0A5D3C2P3_CUCMM|nr:uncharacterized protein E6C27_scaffold262G001880 [Cucumis melo var. makuwa]TYK05655.1 uncharacterized protein E5676_scaffold98G001180 [Cucumis melo var. makuwa]
MAKIYFLENFLLGKQFTTNIDLEHIKLVDDEKEFDAYPWERIGIDEKKICMLIWVVDSHPQWKDLAEMVFDHEQFLYKVMFLEDDIMERSMFHERESTEETHESFEKGEYS